MANFAFALKRALLHLRREIGKETFTLGDKLFLPGIILVAYLRLRYYLIAYSPQPPSLPRSFGIIGLERSSSQVFGFKALRGKVFQNQ
jgi:hypothetical protein